MARKTLLSLIRRSPPALPRVAAESPRTDIPAFKKTLGRAREGRVGPEALVDAMFALREPLPPDLVRKLATFVVEPSVLRAMLGVMVERPARWKRRGRSLEEIPLPADGPKQSPTASSWDGVGDGFKAATRSINGKFDLQGEVEARVRHSRSWTVMLFLTQGPEMLRTALVKKEFVDFMAAYLKGDGAKGDVDPVVAEHVARVLRVLIAEHPKKTCELLSRSSDFVQRLVDNMNCLAVAELLPRLISHQGFAMRNNFTFTKANRKGLAMLGHADIQNLLAKKFANAAGRIGLDRWSLMIIDNTIQAMIEISLRAMMTQRREIDPEDEDDDKYVCHLGVVTSSTFNASLEKTDLLESPGPLATVLDAAIGKRDEALLLVAMKLATSVLGAVVEARQSVIPSLKGVASNANTTKIEEVLVDRLRPLLELIGGDSQDSTVLGTVRLATVELVTSLLQVCTGDEHVSIIGESGVLQKLLGLYVKYETNSLLHGLVVSAATTAFAMKEHSSMAVAWIASGHILTTLLNLWERFTDPRVEGLYRREVIQVACAIRDRFALNPELRVQVADCPSVVDFDKWCEGPLRDATRKRPRPLGGRRPSRMDDCYDVAEELATSEDFGQRLFFMHQLQDATNRKLKAEDTPSEVGVIAHVKGRASAFGHHHPSARGTLWRRVFT